MSRPVLVAVAVVVLVFAFGVLVWSLCVMARRADDAQEASRPRDITIGQDQAVGERLARLRAMQTTDIDVSRKAHPAPPRSTLSRYDEAVIREESRRALDRLKKGW